MVQSPIKFDDLAFILLFFFMIVAIVSFSSSMDINTVQQAEAETQSKQSVTVFLDETGTLSQTAFSEEYSVDLVCDPSLSWNVIQDAVQSIVSQNVEVTLVI